MDRETARTARFAAQGVAEAEGPSVILFDTSVLIDSFAGSRRSLPDLQRALERGERLIRCSIVAYEWLRGPRSQPELDAQQDLFPCESAVPFEAADARIAAKLYQSVRRGRGREPDIAIAACASGMKRSCGRSTPAISPIFRVCV